MNAQVVYTKYLNKEFTTDDFLWHMRRDPMLKEHISPVNTAEDVISILKSRRLIWEEKSQEVEESYDPFKSFAESTASEGRYSAYDTRKTKDWKDYTDYVINVAKKKIVSGWENRNDAEDDKKEIISYDNDKNNFKVLSRIALKKLGIDPADDKNWGVQADRANDDNQGNNENINEAKEKEAKAVETKPTDLTYRGDAYLPKKGEKLTADQVNYYEYHKGWKYELHVPALEDVTAEAVAKAKATALKNLEKDPCYYTNLFATDILGKDSNVKVDPDSPQPTDPTKTPVDKAQAMVPVKGKKATSNVKDGGKKENAKSKTGGVKVMKLKESLKTSIKKMIREDAGFNGNVQAMQGMVKMKPEELAKQVLDGFNQMTSMRKEFAAKVLGKAVADGNTDQTVSDAFHKLSDSINIKKEVSFQKSSDKDEYEKTHNRTNRKEKLSQANPAGGKVKEQQPRDKDSDKSIDQLAPGITYNETDSTIYNAKVKAGSMHKLLGIKPGEDIKSKYKDGKSLYDALMRKVHDHDKVMKMIGYASNIKGGSDVFSSALHHGKSAHKDAN